MKQTQQQSSSSHLNKETDNVRQQNTKAQEKNKNYKMIPTSCLTNIINILNINQAFSWMV